MSLRRAGLWILAALAIAGCAPEPPPQTGLPAGRLARFFDELVYGNAAEPEGVSRTLVRWTAPRLSYAVGGKHALEDDARIAAALGRFTRLTGVAIAPGSAKDAAITVDFQSGPMAPVHDELARCYTQIIYNESGLQQAHIVVNTETPGTLAACLDHELMHAFGFPHHSPIMPSVMSPFRRVDTLSAADQAVLAALYDSRLKAGMTREAVAPALGSVLSAHAQISAAPPAVFSESASRNAADFEWHAIFGDKTAVGFAAPGLEHAVSHHYWAASPDGLYAAEVSLWAAAAAERPRATVRYIRLRDRLHFSRALGPESVAREWRMIADAAPVLSPAVERPTRLGPIRVAEAATAGGPCVVFVGDTREDNAEHRHGRIDGYYCGLPGTHIDVTALLGGLTLRPAGYATPSLDIGN